MKKILLMIAFLAIAFSGAAQEKLICHLKNGLKIYQFTSTGWAGQDITCTKFVCGKNINYTITHNPTGGWGVWTRFMLPVYLNRKYKENDTTHLEIEVKDCVHPTYPPEGVTRFYKGYIDATNLDPYIVLCIYEAYWASKPALEHYRPDLLEKYPPLHSHAAFKKYDKITKTPYRLGSYESKLIYPK